MNALATIIALAYSIVPWRWPDATFTYSCELSGAFDAWEQVSGIVDGGCSDTPEIRLEVVGPDAPESTDLFTDGDGNLVHAIIYARGDFLPWIMLHEMGHALGLGHSENPNAAMYAHCCNTIHADDIAAIRSLYGPPVDRGILGYRTSVAMVAKRTRRGKGRRSKSPAGTCSGWNSWKQPRAGKR